MPSSPPSGAPPWRTALVYAGRGVRNAMIDLRHGRPLNGRWRRPGARREPHTNSDHVALDRIFDERVRPDDVLVDIGCGRGRVLNHWLTRFPGHTVIGLEVDPDVAQWTAHRLRRQPSCKVIAGDAIENLPTEGTLLYLYNPFGREDVVRLRDRLATLPDHPGLPLRVLYHNPKHLDVFEAVPGWTVDRVPLGGSRWAPFDDLAVISRR